MKQIYADKESVKTLPEAAGVYLFCSDSGKPIYVGKAKNLKSRVLSYFATHLTPKTGQMVNGAKTILYIPVNSEFEALLLEAKLVKKLQPKYNSELRDDKSPLYIGITKEEYPRVLALRQSDLGNYSLKNTFGPFISSQVPRKVLHRIRHAIPYSTHKPGRRACVYKEIGLCIPCPSEINNFKDASLKLTKRNEYLKNILKIKNILSGKIDKVKKGLQSEMNQYSLNEEYEEAQKIAVQIKALEYITQDFEPENSYIKNPNLLDDIRSGELMELKSIIGKYFKLKKLNRIECFDIAHLSGTYPTASMVTFINGEPDKTLYRHYRVSKQKKNNDVFSMKSILIRRKASFDKWGKPDLLIVDGGKGQVSAALEVIGDEIPVVGLAKQYETLVFKVDSGFIEVRTKGEAKMLLQRIRDEAHRFARSYHHKLVSKAIREVV